MSTRISELKHLFGERIRKDRKKKGYTQAELADTCGISLKSQGAYERGEVAPDMVYLYKLEKLGFDIDVILGREKDDLSVKEDSAKYQINDVDYMTELMTEAVRIIENELKHSDLELQPATLCEFAVSAYADAIAERPGNKEEQIRLIRYGAKLTAKYIKEAEENQK